MKRWIWAVVCVTFLFASPAAGQQQRGPAKVVTTTVRETLISENAPVTGTLHFDTVGRLSTEVSGLVSTISFEEGDTVKRGDGLVRLNTDFIAKDIDLVRIRSEQLAIKAESVEKDLKRIGALYKESSASEKAYDDLRFTLRELRSQQEALAKELDIAKLKKSKSVVTAPFDGIVLEKKAEVGDWLAPGAVFCRLGALDDLCVKVPVSEELMKFSRKGEIVSVNLVALEQSLEAAVSGVLPVADLRTKNVTVKIRLPRVDGAVENMSAVVRIPTSSPKKLPLVPRASVVNFQGRQVIYTVKDDKASPIFVQVVAFDGNYAAIEGPGVIDGITVIVEGAERLRPEQPVEVVKREGP
jgi:membrane fusion protein, multidrug efflux system